jgi:predicted ATPase/DNA-binding SARP family transcriptional activator
MPPRLTLEFLGLPQLHLDDQPLATDRRKTMALLAYLTVNGIGRPGQRHSRESLSTLLWPDYEQSRAFTNLRRTIWEIHQILGEGWLIADRGSLYWNEEADLDLDVARFENLLVQGRAQTESTLRISCLTEAVDLYRNHFLTGFSLKDAHPFNDWALTQGEDLHRKFSDALTLLVESHCAIHQVDTAIQYARRLVTLDPLNETAHRQLMEVYLQAGQHSAAIKQYQACERILRKELNIDPQPETQALYKRIRKGDGNPVQGGSQAPAPPLLHNLPFQLSTFIGREKQQDEIIRLLTKRRLVTVVGAGGIGKTSLSVQVGHRIPHQYPDGLWFISLTALTNPALVPQTVASTLQLQENSARPMLDGLIDFLRTRTTLLIFDNCEHLLDACASLLISLLQHCPTLHILATSRETLNIAGETVYTMPPLSIPESDLPIDELQGYEAIRLFMDRAAMALPSFFLTAETTQAVVEICRKVDGIPLAIELAAARVNILQPQEILKQLQRSFTLLSSDNPTLLPRHQTLQASMDWSWGLLDEQEQRYLRQLSVFAGGWTLESAQMVCDGNILSLTSALVKKSLIIVDQEPGHETRYFFHEMVREYVHQKLVRSGEQAALRTRHLQYFLDLARQAETGLRSFHRVDWMERLSDERNNIRSALHWAEQTDVPAGLYLSSGLRRYWESSNMREGMEWLETFLNRSKADELPKARATALLTYGWLLTWLQYFDRADLAAQESLSLFRAIGDTNGEVDALILGENIAQFKYDMQTALLHGEQALALSRSLDDPWQEANALYFLGWNTRDYELMFSYWGQAIALYRQVGDQVSLANVLGFLGQFRVLNGDFELAETYLDEAIHLWEANWRANVWENPKIVKSLLLSIRGDHEQARMLLLEVLKSVEKSGNIMGQLWTQVRLGHAALRAGDLEEARRLLSKTADDFLKAGYTIGGVFALEGLAGVHIGTGKPEHAARLIGWADEMRVQTKDVRPKIEQLDVNRLIESCIIALGEVTFSDAYDEGKKMTMAEVLMYAGNEN